MKSSYRIKTIKNADLYIKNWAKSRNENWLNFLCSKIIETRKPANEQLISKTYKLFQREYELVEKADVKKSNSPQGNNISDRNETTEKPKSVTLLSLTHIEGVNALKQDEPINFHPKLTVIYGRNGAGKSGYIRILKKISKAKTAEDIWSDIREKKEKNQCKAKISLAVDGKNKDFMWCGEELSAPFNFIKIFDGKCIPIYLNEKIDFSLTPFGLELFSFITAVFVEIRKKLDEDIESKKQQNNPSNIFTEDTKTFNVINEISADTNLDDIFESVKNVKEIQKKLSNARSEYKRIIGIEDRLKVLQNEEKVITRLLNYLDKINENFNEKKIAEYKKEVSEWMKKEKEAKNKSLTNFSKYGIEKADFNEWHNFISNAEQYIKILDKPAYPSAKEKCIYCNQELSEEAVSLIQSYRDYINSAAEKLLQEINLKQREYCANAESLSYYNFTEDKKDLNNILGEELCKKVFDFLEEASPFIGNFIDGLKNKNLDKQGYCSEYNLRKETQEVKNNLQEKIKQAKSDKEKFSSKTRELFNEIRNLDDLIKLNKNKNAISDYVDKLKWIRKADGLLPKLNTQPVTNCQKKAWKRLVSDSFEKKFQKECENLSTPEIELSFPAEYGVQKRAKSLEGLKNIDEFLSEGEQRSVALADFFAEIGTDDVNAPVIFDDPVNSMDDLRRDKLAQRIYEESQERQLIVFTHDILFVSHLYDKVYNNDKNKVEPTLANFHWMEKDRGYCGKMTENACPRMDKLGRIRGEVEQIIKRVANSNAFEKESQIGEAYSGMREMLECIVVEKLFNRVVERWSERMKMHNLTKVVLDSEKYKKTRALFEEFSGYIKGHSHSAVSKQDFPDLDKLKEDFKKVKKLYEQ